MKGMLFVSVVEDKILCFYSLSLSSYLIPCSLQRPQDSFGRKVGSCFILFFYLTLETRSVKLANMSSESFVNLVDLESGDVVNSPRPRALPRTPSIPVVKADGDNSAESDDPEKKVIVAHFLPLHSRKDKKSGKWSFGFDEDALLFQMKDSLSANAKVVYVGSLKVEVAAYEQEEVAQQLLDEFNCVPIFLPPQLYQHFYHFFCKHYLWPVFHNILPLNPDDFDCFNKPLWQAYVSANREFADKVLEVVNPEVDYVWIHDYHLMIVPTFLRKRFTQIQLGFFLHCPFPPLEVYGSLPVRDEILRGLLHTDLIGFHSYDYARHFLSCCSRVLGLNYESKKGSIEIQFFGRTIYVKILPVGIHLGRLESVLNHRSTLSKVEEIQQQFKDKKVIVGVDDLDIFKGIDLKLYAMEQLLGENPGFQGEVVLVQIINPPRTFGKMESRVQIELDRALKRINDAFCYPGYEPVVLIDHPIPFHEIAAYCAVAECCIVNAVIDGMNLIPYVYVTCRQGTPSLDEVLRIPSGSPRTSTLIVSEFIGCSSSLSGATRVNPWDIEGVARAIKDALQMDQRQKSLRHDKHYRYVRSHDIAYWASSFMNDLERACEDHYTQRRWVLGCGPNLRVLSLPPNFRKCLDHIVSAYKRTSRRAVFLDYDGTLVPHSSSARGPTPEVIAAMNDLCRDTRNKVYLVSGRGKDSLARWFGGCKNLGIAAEHGYFMRWSSETNWTVASLATDFEWKKVVETVMQFYHDATDGSSIERKESALVWHYRDADSNFGSFQAKELLDHLRNILSNDPVVVQKGRHIVEVKPQGVSKGLVLERVLSKLIINKKPAEVILCIGDDSSDEDIFDKITTTIYAKPPFTPEIFTFTIEQKPSKAKYFLNDSSEVIELLRALVSTPNTMSDTRADSPTFFLS